MKDILVKFTELILFSLPVFVLGVQHGASAPVALLIFISLLGVIFFRSKTIQLSKEEKFLLFVFLIFTLFSIFSWWMHGMEKSGLKNIGQHIRFMFFIPVYIWLRCARPRPVFLLYGVIIGAICSLIIALYDVAILEKPRAGGSNNPIMFADMALVLGFMAFSVKDVLQSKSLPLLWRALSILALLCGIAASILSAARGAWIALPALISILLMLQWQFINARYKMAIIVCVFVLPVVLYFISSTGIEYRVDKGLSDVGKYIAEQDATTSLGIRLESWKAAYYMFLDHPLFGVGLGQFQLESQALIERGAVQSAAAIFDHPHNDYFYHLSSNGLIGLFLFVMLYIYPLRLFYRSLSSADSEIKTFSVAGICLIVAFMHFSISETLMIRSAPVSFYGFFVITLVSLIYNRRHLVLKH